MSKKSFIEIWEMPEGKFLYIWLIAMIIYYVIVIIVNDLFISIILIFLGLSIGFVPLWILIYFRLIKKIVKTRCGKHIPNFKYGRIFEYVFFTFLFVASFLSTAFYAKNVDVLYTGLLIVTFTINALFSGYYHYILHFHD